MENKKELIFQIDSPIVTKVFNNENNYKIVYNESSECDKNLCAIYFSSNDIYYPNNEAAFKMSILVRNKFEWQHSTISFAYKHIFFRDLKKQWYIEGINGKIHNPEKLKDFILSETKGYKVFVLGSSAGGYAAITYGSLINALRVYAFNPQFDLNYTLENSDAQTDPLLYKYKDTPRSKYFKVDNFVNDSTDYFYFQSGKSHIDINQYEHLLKKEIFYRLEFDTRNHGFPFLRQNLSYVLELSAEELKELSKKVTHPFTFMVQINGFFKSIFILTEAVLKRMKKKLIDEKRKI